MVYPSWAGKISGKSPIMDEPAGISLDDLATAHLE
jgi:hypothetical protein